MNQVNLLPWREQARQARIKLFGFQALAALLAALLCIIILHVYFTGLLDRQKRRVDFLQNQLNAEQLDLGNLDKQISEQQEIETQLLAITSIRNNNYRIIRLLDELVRVVPVNIAFDKIAYDKRLLVLSGRSKSNSEITLLMNNISHSSVFKQPDLTEITGKENDTEEKRNFVIKVVQND